MDAIDNTSTGAIKSLQDADTALDARLDAIDGGSALTGTALATRVTTIENNIGTGFSSTDTVSKAVSDINTALSGKASSSDLSTLAGRVTSLENNPISSTVLVPYNRITYNSSTGLPTIYTDSTKATLDSTITQDIDYLLADDEGTYSYWKYIGEYPNGTWNLISGGAGGGGTSSAEFYTTLPLTGEDNVDYFIGSGTSYIHYRW